MSRRPGDEELRRADGEARRRAALSFDRPLILEAGAGTGKTTTLVARLVHWCVNHGWVRHEGNHPGDPRAVAAVVMSRITALTFTEKAAAEMSQRLRQALEDLAANRQVFGVYPEHLPKDPAEFRRRVELLLEHVELAVITTIHGWCRRILLTYPMDAGVQPNFDVDAAGRVLRRTVESVLAEWVQADFGDPAHPDALRLLREDIGANRVADVLMSVLQSDFSPEAFDTPAVTEADVSTFMERLLALARPLERLIQESLRDAKVRANDMTPKAASELAELIQIAAGVTSPSVWTSAAEAFEGESLFKRLKSWSRGEMTGGDTTRFGDNSGEVMALALGLEAILETWKECRPLLLNAAFAILARLSRSVRTEFQASGWAVFAELLRKTARLLSGKPLITTRVRREMDLLLVDEVQDTDPLQFEMVAALALEGDPADRPVLFIVGDPKQSIYGWRGADLQAYADFVDRVVALGGEVLRLSVNNRSVAAILDEVDALLDPIMKEERGLQPPFQKLLPGDKRREAAGFTAGGRRPVEYWNNWLREDGSFAKTLVATAGEMEARAMAADILDLHQNHGVPFSHCAVLYRSANRAEYYLRTFREAGIPYDVAGETTFFQRREVIEAVALFSVILDPHDHVSLTSWLRSPMVGVPDAALLPLWNLGFPALCANLLTPDDQQLQALTDLITRCRKYIPLDAPGLDRVASWPESLGSALFRLAHLRVSAKTEPVDEFIEKTRLWMFQEDLESVRFLGAHRLANLERFYNIVYREMAESGAGPDQVLRDLRQATQDDLEENEGRIVSAASSAVQVMTMHKAKGLDFHHVYLVDLHSGRHRRRRAHGDFDLEILHGRAQGTLFGIPTPLDDLVRDRRRKVEQHERVRLLYVAATRPRERVVFSGIWPDPNTLVEDHADQVHLLLSRRGGLPDYVSLAQDTRPDVPIEHLDKREARWYFPPKVPLLPAHAAAEESVLDVDLAAEESEIRRLQQQREAALNHMARRRIDAPSNRGHSVIETVSDEMEETSGLTRDTALESGLLLHRVLETLAFESDDITWRNHATRHFNRRRVVQQLTEADDVETAAAEVFERLIQGPLAHHMRTIAPGIYGREIPFLLSARAVVLEDGPTDAWAGAIDLVYRDPADGAWVVADYKTDRVSREEDVAARVAAYTPQLEVYVAAFRAVRQKLNDPSPVRGELWFLRSGQIVRVESQVS